jgi:hypothetical protein
MSRRPVLSVARISSTLITTGQRMRPQELAAIIGDVANGASGA